MERRAAPNAWDVFERLHGFIRADVEAGWCRGPARSRYPQYRPCPSRQRLSVRNGNDIGCRASARLQADTESRDRRCRRGGAGTLVQGRQGPVFGGGQYRDLRCRRHGEPKLSAGSRASRRRADRRAERRGDLETAGRFRLVHRHQDAAVSAQYQLGNEAVILETSRLHFGLVVGGVPASGAREGAPQVRKNTNQIAAIASTAILLTLAQAASRSTGPVQLAELPSAFR